MCTYKRIAYDNRLYESEVRLYAYIFAYNFFLKIDHFIRRF